MQRYTRLSTLLTPASEVSKFYSLIDTHLNQVHVFEKSMKSNDLHDSSPPKSVSGKEMVKHFQNCYATESFKSYDHCLSSLQVT